MVTVAATVDAPIAAVAGEWSKRYFAKVMRPIATAAMLLDWRLPLTPADLSIDISTEGRSFRSGCLIFVALFERSPQRTVSPFWSAVISKALSERFLR